MGLEHQLLERFGRVVAARRIALEELLRRGRARFGGDGGGFAVPVQPIVGKLFDADSTFDERVASRPELLPAFAAVYGRK
jgi:hypothetical protein